MKRDYYLYLIYLAIGLLVNGIIMTIYTGGLHEWELILSGGALFMVVSIILEKIMKFIYTRTHLPSFVRVMMVVVIASVVYTGSVFISEPELVGGILNLPVYMITFFSGFMILGVIFEMVHVEREKKANEKLKLFQSRRSKDKSV